MKLTYNTVANEICKREESNSREVNITDVKRVMRHFLDIIGEYPIILAAKNGTDEDEQWELSLRMGAGISFVASEAGKRQDERLKKLFDESQPKKAGR